MRMQDSLVYQLHDVHAQDSHLTLGLPCIFTQIPVTLQRAFAVTHCHGYRFMDSERRGTAEPIHQPTAQSPGLVA